MKRALIIGAACLVPLAVLVFALVGRDSSEEWTEPAAVTSRTSIPTSTVPVAAHPHAGLLFGRITTADGSTYEGRLRWGRDQEAVWGDYFDGTKKENPWAVHVPLKPGEEKRNRIEVFGFEVGGRDRSQLQRRFLARFGDIARIETRFSEVRVTLKSGTGVTLNRFEAGDIDDGVRVWNGNRGIVDVDTRQIRTIEFLPTPPLADAPDRLHGVVRTRRGEFTGFVQWNQRDAVSTDTLDGRTSDGRVNLRYDTIRSIERSRDMCLVTLHDGRVMTLSNAGEAGPGNRGIYVEGPRYGRVLVTWDVFERIDFSPGGSGPAYGDFPPGQPVTGSVTTRDGRRLGGRLVYDFDESETTETLDVSSGGVSYAIPLGQMASIVPPGEGRGDGSVTLQSGEALQLDRAGDLGERNAGMLIFVADRERPDHVLWSDIQQIDFDEPRTTNREPGTVNREPRTVNRESRTTNVELNTNLEPSTENCELLGHDSPGANLTERVLMIAMAAVLSSERGAFTDAVFDGIRTAGDWISDPRSRSWRARLHELAAIPAREHGTAEEALAVCRRAR